MVFSSFLNTFRLSFTPNSYQEIDDFGEELIEVVSLKFVLKIMQFYVFVRDKRDESIQLMAIRFMKCY